MAVFQTTKNVLRPILRTVTNVLMVTNSIQKKQHVPEKSTVALVQTVNLARPVNKKTNKNAAGVKMVTN